MGATVWDTSKYVIFCIPFALALVAVIAWLFLRDTFRTRFRMAKQLEDDPDIPDYLIVFNWSRKALFMPTILLSLACWLLMLVKEAKDVSWIDPNVVGGVWLAVFFVNFVIDEYEVSLRILIVIVLLLLAAGLWLALLGWFGRFMELFRQLKISMSSEGYLLMAIILFTAVLVSWIKGLFAYVAITPLSIVIKDGPTDSGEQVAREAYSTRIDTGDFLERVLGFGRIVITFADTRRQPMLLLVNRVGKRAEQLESIRSKLVVDRKGPAPVVPTQTTK